jgi:asparagine synthase (glutamine-hydrolysing)
MSTLGGIYNFDGLPVERRDLVELAQSLVQRGPDGGSEVCSGAVCMVYRAFHTNKQSRREIQPLISNQGHILCWDGRLDNREELIRETADRFALAPTDVELVMKAYQKWGQTFVKHLLGDFALALWDAANRTLILARDPVGPRPLFYELTEYRIVWSSELSTLLDLNRDLGIDDEYVAGYLTGYPEPELTPYKGIKAVIPGNVLVIRNGHPQNTRFWSLNPDVEIRYKTDSEYEEHFHDVFCEAVRCRLRSNRPIWAQLSGGLDSSAIVCMADQIIADGGAEAPRLETVSYIYDASYTSDERAFIGHVEDHRRRSGHWISEHDYSPLSSFPEESHLAFPDFIDCFVDRHNAMCTAMHADGARVLLTGHGGDEILCSRENPSADLCDRLVQYDVIAFFRLLRRWNKEIGTPYFQLLAHDVLLPFVPVAVRSKVQLKNDTKLAPWFDDQFIRRMHLAERRLGPSDTFGFRLPSSRQQAESFLSAVRVVSRASYRARSGIEVSHPYLHIPLVEFLQAVPFDQRVRPGESRSLQRRALRNLLPEETVQRRTKRGPTEALLRGIARNWPALCSLFEDARVCSHGYMKKKELRRALDRARHGCEPFSFALIQTCSLEFWLRALENRRDNHGILRKQLTPPSVALSERIVPARA